MSSISSLSSPIQNGYLSSRFLNKPVVAIVAVAFVIIVALGIYLLKRAGYSLGFAPKLQNNSSGASSTRNTTPLQYSGSGHPPARISHVEQMAALPTPTIEKGKYPEIDFPVEDYAFPITIPGEVIDFAEQVNAHHIQGVVPVIVDKKVKNKPTLWLINCHTCGYFITSEGIEQDRVSSPTPQAKYPQLLLSEILEIVRKTQKD